MRRGMAAALMGGSVLLAGCDLKFKPGAESLLDALDTLPAPVDMAAQATDPYDPNNRYIGTLGLATQNYANEPVYIRLFMQNIRDQDPAVRAAAARGLANHGEPEHVPALTEALKDPSANVRLEAARGLQRLHDASAVVPLMEAMKEPELRDRGGPTAGESDAEIRAQAAHALGQYAEARVVQALIAAIDDSDLAVNLAALSSLRTLTGQDFGLDRAAWADWAARTEDRFAARRLYMYPVFNRPYRWWEYIPFVPKPPKEAAGAPAGMPRG